MTVLSTEWREFYRTFLNVQVFVYREGVVFCVDLDKKMCDDVLYLP